MHRKPKIIITAFLIAIVAITYQLSATGFHTKDLICLDTDGGENIFKQGTVQGYKWTIYGHRQTEPVTDKCIPYDKSTKNRVREYHCDKHRVIRRNIACPEGTICQQGACV